MTVAHFRIEADLKERARLAAKADRRSLSSWFALVVERAIEQSAAGEAAAEREPAQPAA